MPSSIPEQSEGMTTQISFSLVYAELLQRCLGSESDGAGPASEPPEGTSAGKTKEGKETKAVPVPHSTLCLQLGALS